MSRPAAAGALRFPRLRHLLLAAWIGCAAAAGADGGAVVASTEWTAAFARAAGIVEVTVLAPAASRHPAEYQLRPSDLRAVAAADALIFAGYEAMAARLRELALKDATVLRIDTDYSLATLRRSLAALQAAGGTTEAAVANLRMIAEEYAAWRAELAARDLAGAPALVHRFQEPLARELGFDVVAVFGPLPPQAAALASLAEAEVALIIDNHHNAVAAPLAEMHAPARAVAFLNFPGAAGTATLLDVVRHNRRLLTAALDG
ncbi:MAG: ABC transporter substrate-binding protein [Spirochaetaceae bacterium]|nr:ABC transporter substrate-binding protein [Spirochaetaceae bacterium]